VKEDLWALVSDPEKIPALQMNLERREDYDFDEYIQVFDPKVASIFLLRCVEDPDALIEPLKTMQILVEGFGADVNARAQADGRTPIAAVFNKAELGCYLLRKGADVFSKDNAGSSALDMCVEYGEDWLIPAFEAYGGEAKLVERYCKELKAGKVENSSEVARCMQEYVCALILGGHATKAAEFIDKRYASITTEMATEMLHKLTG